MGERVLLVKIDKSPGGPQRLSFSEPIGLCYIAGYLQNEEIDCRLLHIIRENAMDELLPVVNEYQPTTIGFSVRNFNFNITCACIKEVQTAFPGVKTVLGGECITLSNAVDLSKKANVDLTVVSDGEEALHAYLAGTPPHKIPGVTYRTSGGGFALSPGCPRRVPPAELPQMSREGLPMAQYTAQAFPGKGYATMHTQRGCRYKCTFCHTASRYKSPASRTHDQILKEIDYLAVHHDIEALAIWDEDFFADINRIQQLANALIDRGSPIQWHTFMKLTDLKNPEVRALLPALRESGYVRAIIGLESFLPKTLRRYHKAGGLYAEECLQFLSDQGITVCPSYIIGEPHETEKDIAYGLDHLLRLRERGIRMDLPYVAFITPFPGTPLYTEYAQQGLILDDNWDHYDGENVLVKCQCPPDRLVELRDDFYRAFYGDAQ